MEDRSVFRMLRQRLLWPLVLAAVALGAVMCLLTGRTAGHVLSIAMTAVYMAGVVWLSDTYLPDQQNAQMRRLSAVIFGAAWVALIAFYAWHYLSARWIFIFDDSLYYYQQLELAETMKHGLVETLAFVWESLNTDYTYVPNLFMAPLFSATDRSIQGFGMAGVVMSWTPLMYQLRRVTLRLADKLKLSGGRTLLLCAGTCVGVFALPLLHRAAAWCQINLLGLPFLVQVVLLSWNADFRKPEPVRLICLFLSVLMLTLMRRWFIFFLAGYLLLWGVSAAIRLCRKRDWRALRNLALYGACCAALGLTLLWPLFSHALKGNYTVTYSYWNNGGLSYEIKNQSWLLGWGSCALIAAGYAWGVLQRRSGEVRLLTLVMGLGAAASLVLFTRIQNMNAHQATILMPAYVLGLMLFFAMLASCSRRWLRCGAAAMVSAALILQWGVSITQDRPQDVHPALCHVSLKPPVRADFEPIREVSDFVYENCDASRQALFLCNSSTFDRLTFVNLRYPDLSMRDKVALDRIALPSDGFPRAWFSAAYIIVPTQVQTNQPGGTVEKLTHFVLTSEFADRFETVAAVPFGSFDMLILQRKGPVQWDEVEALIALFAEEDALYPKLYSGRIGWYYQQAIK